MQKHSNHKFLVHWYKSFSLMIFFTSCWRDTALGLEIHLSGKISFVSLVVTSDSNFLSSLSFFNFFNIFLNENNIYDFLCYLKDTHREIAPSNNTQVLMKSMKMDIWAVGTLNQLFIRGSHNEIKFSKK